MPARFTVPLRFEFAVPPDLDVAERSAADEACAVPTLDENARLLAFWLALEADTRWGQHRVA